MSRPTRAWARGRTRNVRRLGCDSRTRRANPPRRGGGLNVRRLGVRFAQSAPRASWPDASGNRPVAVAAQRPLRRGQRLAADWRPARPRRGTSIRPRRRCPEAAGTSSATRREAWSCQERVEPMAGRTARILIQHEQEDGSALGHRCHLGQDRLRPLLHEVVEEGVDQRQITLLRQRGLSLRRHRSHRRGHGPKRSRVREEPHPASRGRTRGVCSRRGALASLLSTTAVRSAASGYATHEKAAAVVAALVDIGLRRAQRVWLKGPHASLHLRHGARPRLAAEGVHEA